MVSPTSSSLRPLTQMRTCEERGASHHFPGVSEGHQSVMVANFALLQSPPPQPRPRFATGRVLHDNPHRQPCARERLVQPIRDPHCWQMASARFSLCRQVRAWDEGMVGKQQVVGSFADSRPVLFGTDIQCCITESGDRPLLSPGVTHSEYIYLYLPLKLGLGPQFNAEL